MSLTHTHTHTQPDTLSTATTRPDCEGRSRGTVRRVPVQHGGGHATDPPPWHSRHTCLDLNPHTPIKNPAKTKQNEKNKYPWHSRLTCFDVFSTPLEIKKITKTKYPLRSRHTCLNLLCKPHTPLSASRARAHRQASGVRASQRTRAREQESGCAYERVCGIV